MVRPGPLIGTGATAEVFAYGAGVLKLYHPGVPRTAPEGEAIILEVLEQAGIAAPRAMGVVAHEGRWGLAMSRASGRAFAEAMLADPAAVPDYVAALVDLHCGIHAVAAPGLRAYKDRLAEAIGRAGLLPADQRQRLIAALGRMPDGDRLCHGDFHPFNVLGMPGAAMVIDWVDATSGPPLADLARSYVLLLPRAAELAEIYLAAYLERAGQARAIVEAWLPFVAAGRLAEAIDSQEADLLLGLVGET